MDFRQVVARRRMVRSFAPHPVPDEVLHRILDHARRAPSAGFTQGTEFLVLRGPTETGRFWDATLPVGERGRFPWPGLLAAPVLIVPLANKQTYLDRYAEPDKGWVDRDESRWPAPYWDIDAGFSVMLILLSAVNEGLGALFFGIFRGLEALRATFGIPDAFRPIGALALGYPAPDDRPSGSPRHRPRRPLDDLVHWGHW